MKKIFFNLKLSLFFSKSGSKCGLLWPWLLFLTIGSTKLGIFIYLPTFMKGLSTIGLLIISNTFMTIAWYGHLKLKNEGWVSKWGLPAIILLSWGIALFEYIFQVPANRIGYQNNGGPFNLWQLKVIQEAITLVVFTFFAIFVFQNETFRLNHLIGFIFLILAVFFIFKD